VKSNGIRRYVFWSIIGLVNYVDSGKHDVLAKSLSKHLMPVINHDPKSYLLHCMLERTKPANVMLISCK